MIRPCKGLEPYLYECLASTLYQDYPRDKIAVHFCIASREDPAYPIIVRVVEDHSDRHARIFVEEDDDGVANGDETESQYRKLLGPNPKIRNMSKAYREAGRDDLIWIVDCNVWVGSGVCGRMVDKLCGFAHERRAFTTPYKLVHHLPISVDVAAGMEGDGKVTSTLSYDTEASTTILAQCTAASNTMQFRGGHLEELFLSSSHAKMYVAINAVAVAPCIVGKSTMFRREHLDYLTSTRALQKRKAKPSRDTEVVSSKANTEGIDFFSHNICEDHLVGDLLWKSPVPLLPSYPRKMRNHGLVFGDLAIQPISSMSVGNYISRRVRWLRVRKFTVPVATLVEPGTESFLCSAAGAWGLTTLEATKGWAGSSWTAVLGWWVLSILMWMTVDRTVYLLLHSGLTVETVQPSRLASSNKSPNIPPFAAALSQPLRGRRNFTTWLSAWLGREALALWIWIWAVLGGTSVTWREGRYWVGLDMRVHEIKNAKNENGPAGQVAAKGEAHTEMNGHSEGRIQANGKIKRVSKGDKNRIE